VEYGYSLTQVSGSTTLTITTQPSTSIPTTAVSVSVSFKNGTAVSGAYVSTSVVGANFYWGNDSNVTMYAQTSADGVAQLVVPVAPLTVTASESVQVDLPKSQTTTQVNVGGQLVNVTIYYSPNYVYLSASALLVPPQTSLSMVVTAQAQPLVYPYAEGSAVSGGAPTRSQRSCRHLSAGGIHAFCRSRSHIQQQHLHHVYSSDDHPSYPCIRHWDPQFHSCSTLLWNQRLGDRHTRPRGRGGGRSGDSDLQGEALTPAFSIFPRERDAWTGPRTSS